MERPPTSPVISRKGLEMHRCGVRERRTGRGSCWSCLLEGEPTEAEREAKKAALAPTSRDRK